MTKFSKIAAINFFVLALFILDRILRYFFSVAGGEFSFFFGWLEFKLNYNSGIAFGLPMNFYLLILLQFFILAALVWLILKLYRRWLAGGRLGWLVFFFSLAAGGAFSNFLDRWLLGQVRDYLFLKYFFVFNLGDAMIVLGLFGAAVIIVWPELKKSR